MVQRCEQKCTRDVSSLCEKNDGMAPWNIWEENCEMHSTFWIFSKNSCNDVLASRALFKFTSEVIWQTEMLQDCSEDSLLTDYEYVTQLLEASLVRKNEIVDSIRGDLWYQSYHVEKKEFQRLFDMCYSWTKVASTIGVSEKSVLERLTLLSFILFPDFHFHIRSNSPVFRGQLTFSRSVLKSSVLRWPCLIFMNFSSQPALVMCQQKHLLFWHYYTIGTMF